MDSPTPQLSVAERYQGKQGEEYFKYQVAGAHKAAADAATRFGPYIKPTDTLLDFGCGTGALLAELTAARKIGVEPNPAARAYCTKTHGSQIELFDTVEKVPADTLDIAITNHCLEHVPNPSAALTQIRRALKPGGTMVVCVPIDDWRTQKKYDPSDINHHLHTWTPMLLGHTLHEAGFENADVRIITHAYAPQYDWFYRMLPGPLFDLACYFSSVLKRRRQLFAVAKKPQG